MFFDPKKKIYYQGGEIDADFMNTEQQDAISNIVTDGPIKSSNSTQIEE
jgi:hypothetical protein